METSNAVLDKDELGKETGIKIKEEPPDDIKVCAEIYKLLCIRFFVGLLAFCRYLSTAEKYTDFLRSVKHHNYF